MPFSELGKGEQCKGIKWHPDILNMNEGSYPLQLSGGEFSSCKAYGGFYSSPHGKCVILCVRTITSSLSLLENIFLVGATKFIVPQSYHTGGHVTSMSQPESFYRFLRRSGGTGLSFLSGPATGRI